MEYEMLKALSRNPHYTMTPEERRKLAEYEGEPVVFHGAPNIHQPHVILNNSKLTKRKSYGK